MRLSMRAPHLLLVLATLTGLSVVPDWPHRHLDDPSYWGMIGYLVVFMVLLRRSRPSFSVGGASRRTVQLFLIGLPLVYVADWLRFGGSTLELTVELAGLVIWLSAAVAATRSDLVLWAACVVHAGWDALHLGRVDFVPTWYIVACVAVDVGLGAFVLIGLRESGRTHEES
jgi:hypothetical protein